MLHDHDAELAPEKAAAAELARALFCYEGEDGSKARLLLLSATPYRMLTLNTDDPEEGDHYADFLRTMRFLFGEEDGLARVEELKAELTKFRRALQSMPGSREAARVQRDRLQDMLSQVMARTERVDSTEDRNALVRAYEPELTIETDDLREARAVAHVARLASAPGIVEYWKSAPYLLNFMREYKLRDRLLALKKGASKELRQAIGRLLRTRSVRLRSRIQKFRNARMRGVSGYRL